MLEQIAGTIPSERVQSLTDEGNILSLSLFRDESALEQWRNLAAHRRAQLMGRSVHFSDYRLRIAGVIRDYGMHDREQAPADSKAVNG